MKPLKASRTGSETVVLGNRSAVGQMKVLAFRDLQLWCIGLLVLLTVAVGFAALVLPNINTEWKADGRYLPQLGLGLMSLVILLNIYLFSQRSVLEQTRNTLFEQLLEKEKARHLAWVDPLTELFNRRGMEDLVSKELCRADRNGSPLSVIVIDLDDFKSVNTRFGHLVGDELLVEASNLLRITFRGADSIFRYGGDEFLVLMPDTEPEQAQVAIERLSFNIQRWNAREGRPYVLGLTCGHATYRKGADFRAVMEEADRQMYVGKVKPGRERRKNYVSEYGVVHVG